MRAFFYLLNTLNLNIPESTNLVPDILDEIKWNLDWMLTMQALNDGGVFNKKTSAEVGLTDIFDVKVANYQSATSLNNNTITIPLTGLKDEIYIEYGAGQ